MPVGTDDILDACRLIAREDDLKICAYESMKGAGIAGAGAFVGGMFLGPIGLAIGGAVGGLVAASTANNFTPLIQHLQAMTDQDKLRLRNHLMDVIARFEITDAVMLLALVTSPNSLVRGALTQGMASYFGQNWG